MGDKSSPHMLERVESLHSLIVVPVTMMLSQVVTQLVPQGMKTYSQEDIGSILPPKAPLSVHP